MAWCHYDAIGNIFIYILFFSKKSYSRFLLICGRQPNFMDLAWVNATSPTKKSSRFQWSDSWGVWKSQWKFFHQNVTLYSISTGTSSLKLYSKRKQNTNFFEIWTENEHTLIWSLSFEFSSILERKLKKTIQHITIT